MMYGDEPRHYRHLIFAEKISEGSNEDLSISPSKSPATKKAKAGNKSPSVKQKKSTVVGRFKQNGENTIFNSSNTVNQLYLAAIKFGV